MMQVLKDKLRRTILTEAKRLFLQNGYDRTTLQMIADKANISKGNLYHYFDSKETLFEELTDGAANGLKKLLMRFRDKRFNFYSGAVEFQVLLVEEIISLLLAERYGLLLLMEHGRGTRYENLRPSVVNMLAAKLAPLLADERNSDLLSQMIARNLVDGVLLILKMRFRASDVRVNLNSLLEYHKQGMLALMK